MTFEEKALELKIRFNLREKECQDWGLINADSSKLQEFIDFYLNTDNHQEIVMMFELIIASLEEEEDQSYVKFFWNTIKTKVLQNVKHHHCELIHYSQLGDHVEEDTIFQNYRMLRRWLCQIIPESHIKINGFGNENIMLDDNSILDLIKRSLPIKFEKIIKYLQDKSSYEENTLSFKQGYDNVITDWYIIRARVYGKWTFLEMFGRNSELIFKKFKTSNLEKELSKYQIQ